jgi:nitrite reductase/ring-hydroxylating ferredoxin subunit
MSTRQPTQQPICLASQVPELGKFAFSVLYRGDQREALLVRFKGEVYGYINQCVHMVRRLDCEHEDIFDESGRYLQCSMHSICYDPVSGESMSEICAGKKLTRLQVKEEQDWVYLTEKKAKLLGGA